MKEVIDFINEKTISRESSYHRKVFVSDKLREEYGVGENIFFYEEVVDPQIVIRETDLLKALDMARKAGFIAGERLLKIE